MRIVLCYPIPFITVSLHTLLFLLSWWGAAVEVSGEGEEGMILLFCLLDWPVSLVTLNGVSGVMPRHLAGIVFGGGLQWLLIGAAMQLVMECIHKHMRNEP
jgi:hypothetical protein